MNEHTKNVKAWQALLKEKTAQLSAFQSLIALWYFLSSFFCLHTISFSKRLSFGVLMLVTSFYNASMAQVTLLADGVEAERGEVIDVPIRVAGYNEIVSMQFSLNWDTTVLEFKEINNFTELLPNLGNSGIGSGDAGSGKLILLWTDESLRGISLEDSTIIAMVRFEVIGNEGDMATLAFSDTPQVIEIVDATFTIVDVDLVDAEVSVSSGLSTSATYLQAQNGMRLFQNHPNPFIKNTTIEVVFDAPRWATFTIIDASGKIVYKEQFRAISGTNNILISKKQLPVAGTYTYTIQADRYHLSKQMIVLP